MLSDHERKTLREVERQFLTEDPEFTRSFDAHAKWLRPEYSDGVPARIAIVAAGLLGALMMAAGSPGAALGFVAAAALIWLAQRYSRDTPDQST